MILYTVTESYWTVFLFCPWNVAIQPICHRCCAIYAYRFTPLPLDFVCWKCHLLLPILLFQLHYPLEMYKIKYFSKFLQHLELAQTPVIRFNLKCAYFHLADKQLFCLHYFLRNLICYVCWRFNNTLLCSIVRARYWFNILSNFFLKHHWGSFCCRGYHGIHNDNGVWCVKTCCTRRNNVRYLKEFSWNIWLFCKCCLLYWYFLSLGIKEFPGLYFQLLFHELKCLWKKKGWRHRHAAMHPVYKKDPVHIGLIKIHLIYCIHFF